MHDRAEAIAGVTDEQREATRLTALPKGLRVGALHRGQRDLLRTLLDTYLDRIPDDLAIAALEHYRTEEGLDACYFTWAGGVDKGDGHYYRIQSDALLVEYDNTQRDANHIHSVLRSGPNDFGADVLGDHYQKHHRV
jgi:hypothetical protein